MEAARSWAAASFVTEIEIVEELGEIQAKEVAHERSVEQKSAC